MSTKQNLAGRSTELSARVEEAIFNIACGLREREEALDCSQEHHPFSPHLRSGLNQFLSLHISHSTNLDFYKDLPVDLSSESAFIRHWCTRALADWFSSWGASARAVLQDAPWYGLGPLAEVQGGFMAITEDCAQLLTASDIQDFSERRVYRHLSSDSQENYVIGRGLLIEYPLLSCEQYLAVRAGKISHLQSRFSERAPTDLCSMSDLAWLRSLLELAYEPVPPDTHVCPHCGWTMTTRGEQPICLKPTCIRGLHVRDVNKLPQVEHDSYRLRRGVMRDIAYPGNLELEIAITAQKLKLSYELSYKLWPLMDTCDVLVTLPSQQTLALDAKSYQHPQQLIRTTATDTMREKLNADKGIYVVPNNTPSPYVRMINRHLVHKEGYTCLTLRELKQIIKQGCKEGQ